jgi:hypothetical protein
MSEGFEGIFPSGLWKVDDDDGATNGEYFWGSDDYKPHTGSRSAWLARSGAAGLDPEFNNYPNYANSWMVYGPFDLSGYSDAELSFYYWLNSEAYCDFFYVGASTDGTYFYGDNFSGDPEGWRSYHFALGGYLGETSVWIAFNFQSDGYSNVGSSIKCNFECSQKR